MDDYRFDELTRTLASAGTRRSLLKIVAGGVLGGLCASLGFGRADAKPKTDHCQPNGKHCTPHIECCDGFCCDGWCSDSPCTGCDPGQKECNGVCVDLSTDALHCGACGVVCPPEMVCRNGECQCPRGLTLCDGTCVDLDDPNNCGECGHACIAPEVCYKGQCLCYQEGEACIDNAFCCQGKCVKGTCRSCTPVGSACASDLECCGDRDGGSCIDGVCRCCQAGGAHNVLACGTVAGGESICCEYPQDLYLCCVDYLPSCADPSTKCLVMCGPPVDWNNPVDPCPAGYIWNDGWSGHDPSGCQF